MQTVISFRASAITAPEIRQTLSDYLALERVRAIRRVLVTCFGGLAAIAGSTMTIAHLLSPIARVVAVGVCLVPPIGAWITEISIVHRLLRQAERSPGLYTTSTLSDRHTGGAGGVRKL